MRGDQRIKDECLSPTVSLDMLNTEAGMKCFAIADIEPVHVPAVSLPV